MAQLMQINDEVCIVINALDFYSHIWIGQYNEINNLLNFYSIIHLKNSCPKNISVMSKKMQKIICVL